MSRFRDALIGLTMFGAILAIAHCGGGGGSDPPAGTTATQTNLFFTQPTLPTTLGTSSLHAVDPANPSVPVNVADNLIGIGAIAVTGGTLDPATLTVRDSHTAWVVFARLDGKVYRSNARKDGSLAPVQISSESDAGTICQMESVTDLSDPLKSVLLYRKTGPDNGCFTSDDLLRSVRLDATSSQAPTVASSIYINARRTLYNFATGAPMGVLVDIYNGSFNINGASFCDPFLASCTIVAAPSGQIEHLGQFRDNGKAAIGVDGSLRFFNPQDNTLSGSLFTFRTDRIASALDGSTLYFTDNDCLYRITSTGTGPTLLDNVASRDPGFRIRSVYLTSGKAVYDAEDDAGTSFAVFAVPRAGGSPIVLGRYAASTNLDAVRGSRIYFSVGDFSGSNARAVQLLDDNTARVEETNAKWIGNTLPADVSVSYSEYDTVADRVVLLKQPAPGGDLAGAAVSSLDAATGAGPIALGSLAKGAQDNSIDSLRFSDWSRGPMLGRAGYTTNGSYQEDLLYLDATVAGSLRRLTETPGRYEQPVY